jgi:hypothetical protein
MASATAETRDLGTIELAQMRLDTLRAHAAGVARDDLLVESEQATLIFGDQRRLEPALSIARAPFAAPGPLY